MKIAYVALFALIISSCTEQVADESSSNEKSKSQKAPTEIGPIEAKLEEINHKNGTFELKHPGPKLEIIFPLQSVEKYADMEDIDGKKYEVFNYSLNTKNQIDENLAYHLSFVFMPEVKTEKDIKKVFDFHQNYIMEVSKSKLNYSKDLSKFEANGRQFSYTMPSAKLITDYRMFFKNGVFYRLLVATDTANKSNKFLTDFFDSFKITE